MKREHEEAARALARIRQAAFEAAEEIADAAWNDHAVKAEVELTATLYSLEAGLAREMAQDAADDLIHKAKRATAAAAQSAIAHALDEAAEEAAQALGYPPGTPAWYTWAQLADYGREE